MTTLFITTKGNYSWYLDYTDSQDVENNETTVSYAFRAHKNSGSGVFSLSTPYTWIGYINGTSDSESQTFDMRPVSDRDFVTGSIVVPHNADGTKTNIAVRLRQTASIAGAEAFMPAFDETVYIPSFPTIPRATTPTLSNSSRQIGQTVTISLPRASTSFTHDITYAFGTLTGQTSGLASSSGVATSTTFTVPVALAKQMVGQSSQTLTFTVVTKSGSTVIGTKTKTMTVTPAGGVVYQVPSVSATVVRSLSDGTPTEDGVAAKVTITAAVTSINTGTEQNAISYKTEVSSDGGSSWKTLTNTTAPGGLTMSSAATTYTDSDPGTGGTQSFATSSSYVFKVTVTDALSSASVSTVVLSTAAAIVDIYDKPGDPAGVSIGALYDASSGGPLQVFGQPVSLGWTVTDLTALDALSTARIGDIAYMTTPGTGISPIYWEAYSGSGAGLDWRPIGDVVATSTTNLSNFISAVTALGDLSFKVGSRAVVSNTGAERFFTSSAGALTPIRRYNGRTVRIRAAANLATDTNVSVLTLGTSVVDPGDFTYSSGTLTCVSSGTYKITGTVTYAGNATGSRTLGISVNGGSTGTVYQQFATVTSLSATMTITTYISLAVSDTVEIVGQQNSGGNLSTAAGIDLERF